MSVFGFQKSIREYHPYSLTGQLFHLLSEKILPEKHLIDFSSLK